MKRALLLTAILLVFTKINAQDLEWVKGIGGTGDDVANVVTANNTSFIYVGGTFTGTIDLDPSSGTFNVTSAGGEDIFIARYSTAGQFINGHRIGGTGDDGLLAVSPSGNNVHLGGYFEGTVDFNPNSNTNNLVSEGDKDGFWLAMNSSLHYFNSRSFGGTGEDMVKAVESNNNEVYLSGEFEGTAYFGNPNLDVHVDTLTAVGGKDIFFSYMSSSISHSWTKQVGGAFDDFVSDVELFDGNFYFTGSYRGTVDFDPSANTANMTSAFSSYDVFVLKLSLAGNYVWAKRFSSTGTDEGMSIALSSAGDIFIAGHFNGTCDFDPGTGTYNIPSQGAEDIFICNLNSSGDFTWAKGIGSSGSDKGLNLHYDGVGNLYLTGYFSGTVDFDPNSGTYDLISNGDTDAFMLKLTSSNGSFEWAASMGGSGSDVGKSVYVDDNDYVYTSGSFSGTADFDPASGTSNLTSNGGSDIFIHKMAECLEPDVPTITANAFTICDGDNLSLGVGSANLNGADHWQWYSASCGGTQEGTGASISVSPSATTLYFVRGEGGCVANPPNCVSETVAVNDVPAQPSAISGADELCSGGGTQTYSVTNDPDATGYTWNLPAGWSGSSSSNSITVTPNSNGGNISVTANNSCGSSVVSTLSITMDDVPSQPNSINGASSLCTGSGVQTYSVTNDPLASSYTWTLPSGWTGSSTTNSITATPGSNGGTITVVASNDCGASSERDLSVSVESAPAQPSAIVGSSIVCDGTLETYSVTNDPSVTSYSWTFPNGWIGSSPTNNIAVTVGSSDGTISIIATNSCGTSNASTLNATVNPTPSITSASPNSTCGEGVVDLSATASSGTVNWYTYMSGGSPIATGNNYTTPVISATTTYYAEAEDNGCTSFRLGVEASVNNLPVNTVTVSGNQITSDESNAISYQWFNCNSQSVIPSETNQSFTASSSGSYAVIVMNSDGCVDTSACETITLVGLDFHEVINEISIYPNPSSGRIFVQSNGANSITEVRVLDLLGKEVSRKRLSTNSLELNLPSGQYFMQIQTERGMVVKKVSVL